MMKITDPEDWDDEDESEQSDDLDSNDDWQDLADDYWNSQEGQQHAENID